MKTVSGVVTLGYTAKLTAEVLQTARRDEGKQKQIPIS
jgi:hypothetical protein